jgi:hypothetical protein
MEDDTELLRSPKMARVEESQREGRNSDNDNISGAARNLPTAERHQYHDGEQKLPEEQLLLTHRQQRLLQHWYEDFAQSNDVNSSSDKLVDALATIVHAQKRLILEFIEIKCQGKDTAEDTTETECQGSASTRSTDATELRTHSYSLVKANNHLDPPTLVLVEKYISACRRRRSPNDGRRSVNMGPYRCTFSCGYQTKRAFDWRRHEETHEPQELWLCNLCSNTSPFLVNRKDKFLKHIADKHAQGDAEHMLGKSKVPFVPREELGCKICGVRSGTWDERCRHVLGHYEDEVERGLKRLRGNRQEGVKGEGSVGSEARSVSASLNSGCEGD